MLKISLKGMWAHKRRLVGTVLAVVLGVAFLAGTLMLGDTLKAGFGTAFAEANDGVDAIVRSPSSYSTDAGSQRDWITDADAVLAAVAGADGVADARLTYDGAAQLVAADGDPIGGNGPPTLAGAWLADTDLEAYTIAEGRAPEADGEVVIDARSASDGGLAVGDAATVLVPEPLEVTVVGTATVGDQDSIGGASYVAFTADQAAGLFAPGADQASGVLVAADDGVSQAQVAAAAADALPDDGLEVLTGDELTAQQEQEIENDFLGFFNTLLVVFAGIAMLVAAFSIANTFAILTAQRTRESALLRAVGASRRQILLSTVVEAFVLGVVASIVGLGAGIGLAALATQGVGSLGFPDSSLVLDRGTVITALLVGLVVTVVASIPPAVRASRVPPIAALREVSTDDVKAPRVRFVLGVLLAGVGIAGVLAGVVQAGEDGAAALVGWGSAATIVGVVALGPVVARPVSRLIALPLPFLKGTTGRLARENASRNPRRTAATASALLVGVTVVVVFTILGASINASIQESVDRSFAGDLVIAPQSFSGTGLDQQLADDLDALEETDAIGIGGAVLLLDGQDVDPSVTEVSRLPQFLDVDPLEGDLAAVGAGDLAVEQDYAEERGWALGDTVEAEYLDGSTEPLTVEAIYGSSDLMGTTMITPETWNPRFAQAADFILLVDVADGVSVDAARDAIAPVAGRYAAPDPLDRDEYLDLVAGQINQALGIIYALLVLAIVIALMGITNTLSLSVHERTRELGLLRAVGQTRRQLRSMVRWESVVIALFGTLGGLGLGSLLGWGLYKTIAEAEAGGNGAPTPFVLPIASLLVITAIGALVGVLAAARPARRAARMDVLDAIAS